MWKLSFKSHFGQNQTHCDSWLTNLGHSAAISEIRVLACTFYRLPVVWLRSLLYFCFYILDASPFSRPNK